MYQLASNPEKKSSTITKENEALRSHLQDGVDKLLKEREGLQLEQSIKTLSSKIAESAAIAAVSGALGIVSKPKILSPADKGVRSYLQDDVDRLVDIHLNQKRSGRLEDAKMPGKNPPR